MCGIYGFSKLNNSQPFKRSTLSYIINSLMLENESRGRDSTGIALCDMTGQVSIVKRVLQPSHFLDKPNLVEKVKDLITPSITHILGHTRWATTGAVVIQNAQPFMYRNILGTHNGVVPNYEELFKRYRLSNFTTCDSEIIFAMLSQNATLREKANALSKLAGYFAISFVDTLNPQYIYFARDNNEVSIWKDSENRFLIWSSEKEVIERLALIFNLKLVEVELAINSLLRVNVLTNEQTIVKIPIRKTTYSTIQTANYSGKTPDYCEKCWKKKPMNKLVYAGQLKLFVCKSCLKKVRRALKKGRIISLDNTYEDNSLAKFDEYIRNRGNCGYGSMDLEKELD